MNSLNFMLIFRMFLSQVAFQNYGTVGIGEPCGFEYLVGVSFLEVLAYTCFRYAMKIPVRSRQALIYRSVTWS
ncbi:hypothetical protein Hanom_Chr01g00078521 [Helianthus anomalus]